MIKPLSIQLLRRPTYHGGSGPWIIVVPGFFLVIVVIGLAISSAGFAAAANPPDHYTQSTPESVKIITVDGKSTEQLWPYTSRDRSFDAATLPINVVVMKDARYVRYLLATSTGATWQSVNVSGVNGTAENDTTVESGVVLNGTSIQWSTAQGSTRYTYIHEAGTGRGRWIDETYQVHYGAYLGTRYHLRLYEGGSGTNRWTAIQAHREYWDWFRLRHSVDSVDRAQNFVEREFFDRWFTAKTGRVRYANGGALDADGWVTIIHIKDSGVSVPRPISLSAFLLITSLNRFTEIHRQKFLEVLPVDYESKEIVMQYLPMVALLSILPLTIRVAGITLNGTFPGLSAKVIAGVLYPLLVLGLPIGTYLTARRIGIGRTGVIAAASFGVGMLVDFAYLDIAALPLDIVVHRSVLLVAIGSVALGASRTSADGLPVNKLIYTGAAIWFVGLLVPLLSLY